MSQDPTSRDTFTKNEKNGKLTATQSEHGEKNVDETQFEKLQPGYLLGEHEEFRLVKMLGKGGMGVTWLAEELDSSGKKKQAVVCKILSKELIGNSKAVQNVLEVFDLTKELNHTNICPLLNRFQDPVFKDFLVMRYAEGETLEEWFKKQSGHENGLPAQTVLPVLQQIAAALDAMHLRKIIHRDVKPQNIMFNARNTTFSVPWLIDFGIAQAVNTSDPAQNRRKSGTPIFMAPEQHYGKPQDARTDQYALAVTAFWLLTGHFPFDADTAEELSGKKMVPSNFLSDVPKTLRPTFLRALAYEPKDRFESCGEFVNALSAVSSSVPSFSSKGTAGQTAETQVSDVDTMAEEIYRKMQQEQQEEAERQKERNDQLAKEKAKRAAERLLARQQKALKREEKRRQKAALKDQKKAERLARARLRKEQNGGRPPLFNRRNFLLGGLGTAAALGVWRMTELLNNYSPVPLDPSENGILGTFPFGTAAGERKVWQVDGIYYAFRWCPAGEFLMGSPAGEFLMGSPSSEPGREGDETQHSVTLTRGFWMLETEVTQAMWKSVMGKSIRQQCDKGDWLRGEGSDYPIYYVSWEECRSFCEKLSEKLGLTVSLPTEAQWEYACRAGTTGAYAGNLGEMGWYWDNSGDETHPVGQKKPNAWGLYDMHGNVYEWCQDRYDYDYYTESPTSDPCNEDSGSDRVLRGGSWRSSAQSCRSADRFRITPDDRNYFLGFRPVLASPAPGK